MISAMKPSATHAKQIYLATTMFSAASVSPRGVIERAFLTAAFLVIAAPSSFSQRLQLAPHLHAGQILLYRIDFRNSRNMQTESRVTSPQLPPSSNVNASGLLQVEIVESGAAGLRIKTYYSERNSPAAPSQSHDQQISEAAAPDKLVEVSIAADGSATQIKGLDQLSSAQQFAWNDWLGRFTSSMTFPKQGIRAGQKWETSEPETNPSPIALLLWTKKYQYVRDEPCMFDSQPEQTSPAKSSTNSNSACAVIFIQSTLRQKSSPKNSAPDDYKLRNLKTRGTAAGQNETILYFSRATGLLVRSTEDAQQSLDVLVALADGSNAVHYTLDAKSHSDILLLPDSPQSAR
jgi:hypothetical protein